MPAFDFEAVETRYISGTVVARDQNDAEGYIVNEAYDYTADRTGVEITYIREVEPDCS